MFLHKTMSFRRAFPMVAGLTTLCTLGLALGGCSHLPWSGHGSASAPGAAMTSAPASAANTTTASAVSYTHLTLPTIYSV